MIRLHRGYVVLSVLAAVLLSSPSSRATALTWDSGGASAANPADGAGFWDTSSAKWSDGTTDKTWNNASNDVAVFGNANGAAGIITLGDAITSGGLTFNAATSGRYTISNNTLTLSGTTPTITANEDATIASSLAGTNGFAKDGAGKIFLTGTNSTTLAGSIIISSGTVGYSSVNNLVKTGSRIVLNGGTLQFTNGVGYNAIARGMILTPAGGAIEDATGGSTNNDYAAYTPGVVSNSGSGPRTLTLTGTSTEGTSFQGILSDGVGGATSLIKDGTGYWDLTINVSTYTGDTIIKAGSLRLVTNAVPAASTVRLAKAAKLNIGCNNQTIGNLQDGAAGGGTIMQLWNTGMYVLTVQSGVFSGTIRDSNSSRTLALTKSTSGTLTLSGTNSYTGPTLVSGGTLLINGVSTGTTVSVSGGATLGGSGRIYGSVSTVDTNSHVAPGNSVGTLTMGALDASGGADFVFELGTNQDVLAVTGAFTGSSAAGRLVFDFSNAGGLATKTPYTLVTFGSASGLDGSDLFARSLPDGLVLDTSFGGGNGFKINANSLQVQFMTKPGGTLLMVK